VQREVETMQRDGRWQKLMADGQAEQQAQPHVIFRVSSPTSLRRGR
jgi:hypothetical protein